MIITYESLKIQYKDKQYYRKHFIPEKLMVWASDNGKQLPDELVEELETEFQRTVGNYDANAFNENSESSKEGSVTNKELEFLIMLADHQQDEFYNQEYSNKLAEIKNKLQANGGSLEEGNPVPSLFEMLSNEFGDHSKDYEDICEFITNRRNGRTTDKEQPKGVPNLLKEQCHHWQCGDCYCKEFCEM